jgi:hypothetical protein
MHWISVADPGYEIRDPVLFYPPGSGIRIGDEFFTDPGSGMSYHFDFKDFFLKP